MATVGSLAVNFTAKTAAFLKGTKKARKSIARFGSAVGRVGKAITKFGAAGAAAAAGGLAFLVKKQTDAIDQTAKLARMIGASTEELVKLRVAAERTGAGADALDAGLEVMAKRLGEVAVKGSGAAKDAIQKLGLNVNELIKMKPSEQFRTIAQAMQGLSTQSERNAVAANIFSRANQGLVNTLALGRKGLEEVGAEAEKTGLVFSATAGNKVEQMADAMARVGEVVTGLGRQLTIKLAPFITAAANKLASLAKSGGGMAKIVTSAFESVVKGLAKMADWLKLVEAAWHGFKATALLAFKALLKPLNTLLKALGKLGEALGNDTLKTVGAFGEALDKNLGDRAEDAAEKAKKAFKSFRDGQNEKKVAAFFDDIRKKAEKLAQDSVSKAGDAAQKAAQRAMGASGAGGGTNEFRQIVRSRVAIGGVQAERTQRVKAPQLDETNMLLRQLVGQAFPATAAQG